MLPLHWGPYVTNVMPVFSFPLETIFSLPPRSRAEPQAYCLGESTRSLHIERPLVSILVQAERFLTSAERPRP